ncbi:MAG: hypothetical protein CL933_18835 [Deltaproteobacteria bacterium]|nr:hypothetical protein [Deltaproteobacteria bacterium]
METEPFAPLGVIDVERGFRHWTIGWLIGLSTGPDRRSGNPDTRRSGRPGGDDRRGASAKAAPRLRV